MATLEASFERDLQEAMLDEVESEFIGQRANLAYQFVELVHTNLRAYAQRNGYDISVTIDSLGTPAVERTDDGLTITVGWESDQMARWEFGTSDHTVDGNPVLSFVWEARHDPPDWVREEFDQARASSGEFRSGWRVFLPSVEVDGIPESRAIRDALNALRRLLES